MRQKMIYACALTAVTLTAAFLTACGAKAPSPAQSGTTGPITVVSREDGSGTRGAFIELFGVQQKDAQGKKTDYTTEEAAITNSTAVMMTSVAGNISGIGYISMGSLNDTVKALQIDGAAATAQNVKAGSYKIARPFNIVTSAKASAVAEDFIAFILSSDGQAVVEKSGYIPLDNAPAYAPTAAKGSVVIAGSSSITPVMEKLKEAYIAINPDASLEIQQSDSTTGMQSAIDGICDIGMASRALSDSEKAAGLTAKVIATDGIAVIVNRDNILTGLSAEQVKQIFTGEVTVWEDVAQ